jgi:hypothetical protein
MPAELCIVIRVAANLMRFIGGYDKLLQRRCLNTMEYAPGGEVWKHLKKLGVPHCIGIENEVVNKVIGSSALEGKDIMRRLKGWRESWQALVAWRINRRDSILIVKQNCLFCGLCEIEKKNIFMVLVSRSHCLRVDHGAYKPFIQDLGGFGCDSFVTRWYGCDNNILYHEMACGAGTLQEEALQ